MWSWTKTHTKASDIFGVPISLKYKGETSYKTYFGGMVSILIFITSFSAFLIFMAQLLTRSRITIETNTLVNSVYLNNDLYKLENPNFGVSWGLVEGYNLFNDSTYFTVSATEITVYNDFVNNIVNASSKSLTIDKCGDLL